MLKLGSGLWLLCIGLLAGLAIRDADAFNGKLDRREDPVWSRRVLLASRNASGTMSAINGPYISGTTISSAIVNARLADIESELTDSLSRSGKGGMLATLRGVDGTVAAPAYSFTSEPGTGMYRIGANDLGLAVGGVKQLELTTTATTVVQPTTFSAAGTFNTTLGVTGATTLSSTLGVTGILTASSNVRGADGLVGTPEYSFTNDTGSGLYRIGANNIGFAINGVKRGEWGTVGYAGAGTITSTGTAAFNSVVTALAATSAHGASNASQSTFTQSVANNAFAVESNHTNGNYLPGIVWYTSDDNATKPKAGVYMQDTISGSVLELGTSNSYATGITTNVTIDQTGQAVFPGGVKVGTSGTASAQANFGSCATSGGTPSTCTATVGSGVKCAVSINEGAHSTDGCSWSLSGTTLTIRTSNGIVHTCSYLCF